MTLSIITINYNNCEGLKRTIQSVLAQTWHDFEWIVIDGGSTDGSKELITNLNDNPNANLSYWCSEPDKGIYNAMNKGIAHATGEYLNFMNSGDFYYEEKTLARVFEKANDADVLYGDWEKVYDNHSEIVRKPMKELLRTFWRQNVCQQAIFYRKSCLLEKGYDDSFRIFGDWARNIQLSLSGVKFVHLPITICKCDMNGISHQESETYKIERNRVNLIYPSWLLEELQNLDAFNENKDVRAASELMRSAIIYRYPIKFFVRVMMSIKRFLETSNQ